MTYKAIRGSSHFITYRHNVSFLYFSYFISKWFASRPYVPDVTSAERNNNNNSNNNWHEYRKSQ